MESVLLAALYSWEDEQQSDPENQAPEDGFIITPRDASVLKVYLEEFQDADRPTRKKILGNALGELYALRPPNAVFDKREAMKVRVPMSSRYLVN